MNHSSRSSKASHCLLSHFPSATPSPSHSMCRTVKKQKHDTWLKIIARLSFCRSCHVLLSSRCSAGACASPEHLTSEPQHGGQGDSVNISFTRYSRIKNKELRAASTCGGICAVPAAPLLRRGGGGEPPLPAPHLCTSASPPAS